MFPVSFLPPRFKIIQFNSMFSLRLETRAIFQIGSKQLLVSLHLMQAVVYFYNDL